MKEELIEFIAERDDMLFNIYLEGGYEPKLWLNTIRNLIKENEIFISFSGSALLDLE